MLTIKQATAELYDSREQYHAAKRRRALATTEDEIVDVITDAALTGSRLMDAKRALRDVTVRHGQPTYAVDRLRVPFGRDRRPVLVSVADHVQHRRTPYTVLCGLASDYVSPRGWVGSGVVNGSLMQLAGRAVMTAKGVAGVRRDRGSDRGRQDNCG